MKTIILAAGIAKRLKPLTNEIPKCLLKIKNKTLLRMTIEACTKNDLRDLLILTGHGEALVNDELKKILFDISKIKINSIFNPDYAIKNNCYSLYLAIKNLDEDIVVINSDDVFDDRILAKLNLMKNSALVIDNVKTLTEESMKIYYVNDRITDINKKLDINKSYGESIGIAKIIKKDLNFLRTCLDEVIKTDSNLYYEDAFQLMFDKINFSVCDTDGLRWTEVDNMADYKIAKNLVAVNFASL